MAKPQIVIPTFGLIYLAIAFGNVVYRMKFNLFAGTSLAIVVLSACIAIEANDKLLLTRGRKMVLAEVHPAWTEARE